ncbi:hypothetical protein BOTBODRAFT_305928 [Botryobasidium botryosum FD-172 SS1]|uniref:RNA-binding domain-containing protein n=1 Tax=Botryobasidium botryosum (strain FD-172 SS1) TaxID=930990 RepID=A0A067N0D5_BOTB1|nr:hypothetical protein BOTBODRAFT_305928 [Botryobasidium botryosum FD-172 SS1]
MQVDSPPAPPPALQDQAQWADGIPPENADNAPAHRDGAEDQRPRDQPERHGGSSPPRSTHSGGGHIIGQKPSTIYREKQIKPNKVYIGGLPEHTRQEDLQTCFGKIGPIASIELKLGYGFVEFESREAAEESVAKYHEGHFMGNKIRVELSHGGGKTAKFAGEPGACFKCGQQGHWARECPNHVVTVGPPYKKHFHHHGHGHQDHSAADRPPRDYPPPPRDHPPYRDDRYGGGPPYDRRYSGPEYPSAPPPGRDYRHPRDARPPSPPRDYRDYPGGPPPYPPYPAVRAGREYDDYRRDYRGGAPPPVPPSRYDSRPPYYPPELDHGYPPVPPPRDGPHGYPPRSASYGGHPSYPPGPREPYDRGYDKRSGPPPNDRYPPYPLPAGGRPRSPPPPGPPRGQHRDDFDRPPR